VPLKSLALNLILLVLSNPLYHYFEGARNGTASLPASRGLMSIAGGSAGAARLSSPKGSSEIGPYCGPSQCFSGVSSNAPWSLDISSTAERSNRIAQVL